MAGLAVFWDRDNTIIEDPGYLDDPEKVRLLSGAAAALRRVSEAGFENIVVTNQSGIARGLFDEQTLEQIHDRLCALLAKENARLDAIYYCPYLDGDEAVVPEYRQSSDLRKPAPGMLLKAALERHLDLPGSWVIGDSLIDAQAGRAAGCRTILVADHTARAGLEKHSAVDFVVDSVEAAAETVLEYTRSSREPNRSAADSSVALLTDILKFLRMVDRRQQSEDFSLARFGGAIVQMIALGGLIWAIFGMIYDISVSEQVVRLLFAVVLQLLALTLFMLSSRS